jgi:hypothetical protein
MGIFVPFERAFFFLSSQISERRRELLHAYLKATAAETRAVNELCSYLNQFQIRLEKRNPRPEQSQLMSKFDQPKPTTI